VLSTRSTSPASSAPGCRSLPSLRMLPTPSPRPSCCGHGSNMSGWSESAGDGPRSSDRDAEPAQADGDP
jgi:hypothetical protein